MTRKNYALKFILLFFPKLTLLKTGVVTVKSVVEHYNKPPNVVKKTPAEMRVGMKVGIGSFVTFLFIIIFGFVAFPKILTKQIKGMTNLGKGNDVREMYIKVPFPLVFKVRMFNVTNPVEVTQKGARPIVQEVGPYVYDEWKEKVDIEDNEEEDTMVYTIKNTFYFNQAETGSLTGNEIVTIPHPLICGLAMAVEKEKPAALTLINKALNSIHRNPVTPFLTATVNEILFDGVLLLCNVSDFAGKAVCSQLKAEAKDLVEVEPMIFKFSLFGPKNGTKAQRVKVKRGVQESHDTGRVVEFEGKPELSIWGTKECNQYEGSDSTIFPPFLTKEEGLVSFAPDICRSLPAYYVEDAKYAGLPVRRYTAEFGDMSADPGRCYCPTPETCFKKGVTDLYKCVGAPFIASLPHFYLADPSYGAGIVGLNPNKEDHEITILFESMTGSPVSAKKRLQFNLPVHALQKVSVMKNMPDATIPLFWVEEGIDLNTTWTGQLKNQLFRMIKIMKILKYTVLVLSICGIGAGIYLHYSRKVEVITPIHETHGNDKEHRRNDVISMIAQQQHKNNMDGGHINHAMSNNEIDKF